MNVTFSSPKSQSSTFDGSKSEMNYFVLMGYIQSNTFTVLTNIQKFGRDFFLMKYHKSTIGVFFSVVTKMGPRPSLIPDLTPTDQASPPDDKAAAVQTTQPTAAAQKTEPGKPTSRAGACRVCLKVLQPDEKTRTCSTCTQKVCDDCHSYSGKDEKDDPTWSCSVCRRLGHLALVIRYPV